VEKYCREGQTTIWRMRIVRWIPKGINTHTHTLKIRNTHCFSKATSVELTRANVTLYVHFQSGVNEMSVYCAVRTGSLKTDYVSSSTYYRHLTVTNPV